MMVRHLVLVCALQEGDLAVHFVHTSKDKELSLEADWLNKIPVLSLSSGTSGNSARVFGVRPWKATGHRQPPHGQQVVKVLMESRIDLQERLSADYLVAPAPSEGNLGWPVHMPKLMQSLLAAAIARH